MEYRRPEIADEQALAEYVREHRDNGEQGISASHRLTSMPYPEWVSALRLYAAEGSGDLGKTDVLLCIENGRIIGLLSVRYELTEALRADIGDIGYGVRPKERRKGYATVMLKHAADLCREKGMKEVLLGCYKDNTASVKVITNCGGTLTRECDTGDGNIAQYYTIKL